MPTRSRVLHFAFPALLLAAQWALTLPAAAATRPDTEVPGAAAREVRLEPVHIGNAKVQHALSQSAPWRSFESRAGHWNVSWNEATGTPHRAFGPSIPLAGFANDAVSADHAVRAFIAGHPGLFGGAGIELKSLAATRSGNVWYVRYQQQVHGVPVLYSDWEFRVGTNGRLMMFGADARAIPATIETAPRVVAAAAREAAHAGETWNPAVDRVELANNFVYVPVTRADGSQDLRLAYEATVQPARFGSAKRVIVDAGNGQTLLSRPLRDDVVTGTVTAQIHASGPYDALTTRPLRNAKVNAGTPFAIADSAGLYSVSASSYPTTLTSSFTGPYCTVMRIDGAAGSFSKSTVANSTVQNVAWTTANSQPSERDAYYHTNLAHDWVKAIDPALTAIDYSLTVNVNWNDGTDCEGYWDQLTNSLNYWLEGATCPNTATIPDLVWHEYAHMVNYNLYFANGAAAGLQNGALAEGLADAFTVLLGNEPLVGNGFTGLNTFIRDVRVGARYPENDPPDSHVAGLILAGALWDLKVATNVTTASRLMHFAKYGLPDDPNDGVALSEYFLDVLVADDNDADLSNGTPNLTAINTSFSNHGIGMNYFLSVAHDPLDDQPSNGPFPINATITFGGPIGGLGNAKLYYSVNRTPYVSANMLPTGNPDEYGAEIPNQSYGVVRYYLVITDSYGGTLSLPPGAPALDTYAYVAGPATTLLFDAFEAPDGWATSYAPDTPLAVTGIWERGVPVASLAQPGADHSPSGTQCYFTGNAPVGADPGVNDVDGGKTTLVTTTFNAAPAGIINPIISYWRWYSNNVGDAPNEDPWRVYISNNNGSTWAIVENTKASSTGWQRKVFAIKDFVTPTSTMKMRFVAQDTLNPSIVEAALDDWSIVGYSSVLGVPSPPALTEFAMQPAWPNPSKGATHLSFTLPTTSRVEIAVFDLEGRRVRSLLAAEQPPGAHSVSWDGRDNAGKRVASGPYFVRLTRGAQTVSRAVVLMR